MSPRAVRPATGLAAASLAALSSVEAAAQETSRRVMSFNIWGGGANEDKSIDETVAAIVAAGADIVGLQETGVESDPCEADHCPLAGESRAAMIAAALGFRVQEQTAENDAPWANAATRRTRRTITIGSTSSSRGATASWSSMPRS